MRVNSKLKIIALLIAVTIIVISNGITQLRIFLLNGKFEKLGSYEIPKGHVYEVAVNDTLWEEMKQYGNIVSKQNRSTEVYFVIKDSLNQVKREHMTVNLLVEIRRKYVAKYSKDLSGEVSFEKGLTK